MKKYKLLLLALLMITGCSVTLAQRITVTVAGNDASVFNGDTHPGLLTNVSNPNDVCADAAHNVYFSDAGNNRVRKLSANNGHITTVAGGGSSTANGVPATSASLSPEHICIDAIGNLYVSQSGIIREIDAATGTINTIAGPGSGSLGDGGPATGATFGDITGICLDAANNIYVATNTRIRKIAAGTYIVATLAGTGAPGYTGDGGLATAATLNGALGIAVNSAGNIFFTDQMGNYIREINTTTRIISTIAGGGGALFGVPATAASMTNLTGFCVDPWGNFYFNEISCLCRQLNISSDSVFAVGGNYGIEGYSDNMNSLLANMNNPQGLCADGSTIYIADKVNSRIRKLIQLTHVPTFVYGKGQFTTACSGTATSVGTQMRITDLDLAQPETWSVLSLPVSGTLSGFPNTTASSGTDSVTKPASVYYTSLSGFAGTDSFRVRVSDGVFSDTTTVYVQVSTTPSAGVISLPVATPDPEFCAGATRDLSETISGGLWSVTNTHLGTIDELTGSLATGASRGGIDTIIYTLNNTCTVTTSFVVTIDTFPLFGPIMGPSTVCVSSIITLSDIFGGGSWSASNTSADISGSGVVTGISPGTDEISYTFSNVCGSSLIGKVISIVDSLPPVAGTITGTDTLCTGAVITLSDTVSGGAWSASNGNSVISTAGVVTGVTAGTDIITYSMSNICGTVATSQEIVINDCVGLAISQLPSSDVTVFPNPATDYIVIENIKTQTTYHLQNILGATLQQGTLSVGSNTLSLQPLPAGIYMLELTNSEGKRGVAKIIKQ